MVDNSRLQINLSDYENDVSLKAEFIKLAHKEQQDGSLKDMVIDFGLKALLGEDIDLWDWLIVT